MSYVTQSEDVDPEVERIQLRLLRELPTWRKAEMIDAQTRASREWSLAGIRSRHPDATERENQLRLAALSLGRETMVTVFGWDPDVRGW